MNYKIFKIGVTFQLLCVCVCVCVWKIYKIEELSG